MKKIIMLIALGMSAFADVPIPSLDLELPPKFMGNRYQYVWMEHVKHGREVMVWEQNHPNGMTSEWDRFDVLQYLKFKAALPWSEPK